LLAHFEVRQLTEAWVAQEGRRGKRETKGLQMDNKVLL